MNQRHIMSGISVPFYPMRPKHGTSLMSDAGVARTLADVKAGDVVQPKLNGDRACVAVDGNGDVVVQNRHGGEYKFGVSNLAALKTLPPKTVIDGEVHGREFLPFEVVAYAGESLTALPVEARVAACAEVCKQHGLKWKFAPLTIESFMVLVKRGRVDKEFRKEWEGVVIKQSGSKYRFLGSEGQESDQWFKRRFE